MNSNKYELTESVVFVNEVDVINSYGVRCLKDKQEVKKIDDISPNKTAVEKFIHVLNENNADPIQLEEFIEDHIDELI